MTTPLSTPCRAKNPATCKYHGPELKAAEAAAVGNWDEVLVLLQQRDANKAVRNAEIAAFALDEKKDPAVPNPYDMTHKQRINYLEGKILEKDLDFRRYFYRDQPGQEKAVDKAVAMVAKYTPGDTIFDIAEQETKDSYASFDRFFEKTENAIAAEIVPLWQDSSALLGPERNLLVAPSSNDWRDGFRHELAKALAERGKLMNATASYYGWEDYDYVMAKNRGKSNEEYNRRPYTVVSVLHVAEDEWGEFEGTFATSSETHVGVSGWGVLDDGSVHRLRLEEEFGSLLKDITRDRT